MKRIKIFRALLLIGVFISVCNLSYGQYKGPGVKDKTYSVTEVIVNATSLDRSDALVKVQGYIIKQINDETYKFKDKTGTINVDIDRKRLPNRPFDDKTEIILIGEVDSDFFKPVEIEVKEVIFVEPDNKAKK